MAEQDIFEDEQVKIDFAAGKKFVNTSKWTLLISFAYFVGIAFGFLVLFFAGDQLVKMLSEYLPEVKEEGAAIKSALGFVLLFLLMPSILLFRFGRMVRKGLEQNDQHLFNEGLRALKNYFMVYGILAVLTFVTNAFSIIASFFNRF